MRGIGINRRIGVGLLSSRGENILAYLESVFTALWYPVSGTSMIDMFGGDPLTLSADPGVNYIPATYAGTITAPDVQALKDADAAGVIDGPVLYNGAGTPQALSVSDFIDTDLQRIPVKYDNAAPHHIRMIGLLDPAVFPSLTDADKDKISRYMDLWIYFWSIDHIHDGKLKENRTIGEGGEVWILSDGVWRDEGTWIDTEVWID